MSLQLVLERGPHSQTVRKMSLDNGQLVIGRGSAADWQITDPDMYVSRVHCTITGDESGYFVTDNSSSGLFIDGTHEPLGTGNSVELHHGMRLRLGDFVIAASLSGPPQAMEHSSHAPEAAREPAGFDCDDFFAVRTPEEPAPKRPTELPDPFEEFGAHSHAGNGEDAPHGSQAFDDPFSLEPVATPQHHVAQPSFADGLDFVSMTPPTAPPALGLAQTNSPEAPKPEKTPQQSSAKPPAPLGVVHAAASEAPAAMSAGPNSEELRLAFLRGLGIEMEGQRQSADAVAEMEKFGREYRLMMDGLMQLLRKRSEEKGNARIQQTIVGASEVNPLKFLPGVDDVIAILLLAGQSRGFMDGERAIIDAVRDLAQHHVRAWRGVQGALRNMIDRFDPKMIEAELKESSTVEQLLAGGRNAKLWELYKKRHREIAANAESRFLGDLGADFRNAYEGE